MAEVEEGVSVYVLGLMDGGLFLGGLFLGGGECVRGVLNSCMFIYISIIQQRR